MRRFPTVARRWLVIVGAAAALAPTGCGTATAPTAPTTVSTQQTFTLADSLIVFRPGDAVTGDFRDIHLYAGDGTNGSVSNKWTFDCGVTALGDGRFACNYPGIHTVTLEVGADYWIRATVPWRPDFLFSAPDYGDAFVINGQPAIRTDRMATDVALRFTVVVRRFRIVDVTGRIE